MRLLGKLAENAQLQSPSTMESPYCGTFSDWFDTDLVACKVWNITGLLVKNDDEFILADAEELSTYTPIEIRTIAQKLMVLYHNDGML